MRPDQVVRMTDSQSRKKKDEDRLQWAEESLKPSDGAANGQWYAANTREPIRDETLRHGFIPLNAVVERTDLPTTSSKPRYALRTEFAELFAPDIAKKQLTEKIQEWRQKHLSHIALARTELVRKATARSRQKVRVEFPNGESRIMEPGPSSVISKAVIEDFAVRFLAEPAVIWLSESGNKVFSRDDHLAHAIGLNIISERLLPDIILADVGKDHVLLVFVEVVATDGAVTEERKDALREIATNAGFGSDSVAFLTAFLDRENQSFRKCVSTLAWQSFAWSVAEPQNLIILHDGSSSNRPLSRLLVQ